MAKTTSVSSPFPLPCRNKLWPRCLRITAQDLHLVSLCTWFSCSKCTSSSCHHQQHLRLKTDSIVSVSSRKPFLSTLFKYVGVFLPLTQLPSLVVIFGCITNHSKPQWLKTTDIYCLTQFLWVSNPGVAGLGGSASGSFMRLQLRPQLGLQSPRPDWGCKSCFPSGSLTSPTRQCQVFSIFY